MTATRGPFDDVARSAATKLLGARPEPFAPRRMSSFASWFHDADDQVLVAVAVPGAPARAADEVLAYALAWQGNRDLILVMAPEQVTQTRLRLPWIQTSVKLWSLSSNPAQRPGRSVGDGWEKDWDLAPVPSWSRAQALTEMALLPPRNTSEYVLHPTQQSPLSQLEGHLDLTGLSKHSRASYLSWQPQLALRRAAGAEGDPDPRPRAAR